MSENTNVWSESTKNGLFVLTLLLPIIGLLVGFIGLFTGNSESGLKLIVFSIVAWFVWFVFFLVIGLSL